MSLREANDGDLERVVEIYNSSIVWRLSTADTIPVSVESKKDWYFSHTKERPLLVYEYKGRVIGWASVRKFNERPAYIGTAEISIYVDHDYIGRGIGTTILSECRNLYASLRLKKVIANVFSHNEASLKLFHKFGFMKWGELIDVCEMDNSKYSVTVLGLSLENT